MSKYEQLLSNSTVTNGGGTASAETNVDSWDSVQIQINGDTNSTNLDVNIDGETLSAIGLVEYDHNSFQGEDLTANGDGNGKILSLDTEGLNKIEIELANQAASDTTVDLAVGKRTHN